MVWQRVVFLSLLLYILTPHGFSAGLIGGNGLTASGGLEYQKISQSYYNAILDTTRLDPIETWQLTRDDISDLIGRADFEYNWRNLGHRINISGEMEASGNRMLGRAEGHYLLGDYDRNIKLSARYENKSPFDTNHTGNDGYNYLESYLSGTTKVAPSVALLGRVGWEMINFYPQEATAANDLSVRFLNYDYSIFSGQIGANIDVGESSRELSCLGSFYRRLVPDSSAADYNEYRTTVEFNSIGLREILNLETEFSFKDYGQIDNRDDFGAVYSSNRYTLSLDKYELQSYLKYDLHSFRKPDLGNQSYQIGALELKAFRKIGQVGLGPVACYEIKDERPVDGFSESYHQWEGGIGVSALDRASFFCDAEATFGSRIYRDTSSFLSSYHFISLSVIANYTITKHLSFSLLFDGNFELHPAKTDNNNLYFLTAGLTGRF